MSVIFYYTYTQSFKNWTFTLEYNGQVSKAQTWARESPADYELEKILQLSGSTEV